MLFDVIAKKYSGEENGGWLSVLQTDPALGEVKYLSNAVTYLLDNAEYKAIAAPADFKEEIRYWLLQALTTDPNEADLFTDSYWIEQLQQYFPEMQVGRVYVQLASASQLAACSN